MFRVIHIDGAKTNYAINEEGTIININTGCALHPNKLDRLHRYRRVHLTINGEGCFYSVHRLVMETFRPISNPQEMQVNHIDGDRNNNSLSNLEWITASENVGHAFRTGLSTPKRGELNGRCVLSDEQVHEICLKICEGKTECSLANEYGVSKSLIHAIKNGDCRKDISDNYTFPKKSFANSKMSEEDVVKICKLILQGYSYKQIAPMFGVTEWCIKDIKLGRTWTYITDAYLKNNK